MKKMFRVHGSRFTVLALTVALFVLALTVPRAQAVTYAYFKAPSTMGTGTAVVFNDGTYAIVDSNNRLYADVRQSSFLINQGFAPWLVSRLGSVGGWTAYVAEASVNLTADVSPQIAIAIPSGAVLEGVQLRVDTALDASDNWLANWTGGSTAVIVASASPNKNVKVNTNFNANGSTAITTAVTNIVLGKTVGGTFHATGTIRAVAYYRKLDTLPDAP